MARAVRTILIAMALAGPYVAAAQAPELAIVEGSVINAQNSRTIPRASVSLEGTKGVGSQTARADGSGHFIFAHVEPGFYRLIADRQGYFSDEKRGYQPTFSVSSGQHLENVAVRLMPTAVVSGEIVDEYNDVLQDVEVKLLATRTRLGRMYLSVAGIATTDDRGQYRISGLRPGKYYLVAEYKSKARTATTIADETTQLVEQATPTNRGQQVQGAPQVTSPDPPFTYPPLFYPATGDFQQAQSLRLSPGDELAANFILISSPVVSIKGRVTNGMTGAPVAMASVAAYWTEYVEGAGIAAKVSQDGTFEVRGLAPGLYTVRATFTDAGENFAGEQMVELGDQGAQNVEVAALPDFAAAGHVTILGDTTRRRDRVVIEFAGEGLMPRVRASAGAPEFKFDVQLRPEKRYRVRVFAFGDDYYLKSVLLSGHEVPPGDLVVSGRRGNLELVLSPFGGRIEGKLFDHTDKPTRGTVLLVPDLADPGPPELFRRASADAQGQFTFPGLTPGSYRMVAVETLAISDMLNEPDFSRKIAGQGDLISVEESGRYSVVLKLAEEPH